jgi:glycosyltransferase involved in cell wall biosynthesis
LRSVEFKVGKVERSLRKGIEEQHDEIRIVFITPLPPPNGGIASWSQAIVRCGLPEPFQFRIVNSQLRKRRPFEKIRLSTDEIWRNVRIVGAFVGVLLSYRAHLVHINCSLSPQGIARDWLCGGLARLLGRKLVVNYRGDVADFSLRGWGGLGRFFLKNLAQMAHMNLVLNQSSYDALGALEPGAAICKFPNFVLLTETEITTREHLEEWRVLFVGGIAPAKGIGTILALARRLENVCFWLVGSPVEHAQEIVRELDMLPNVRILGQQDNSKVRQLMREVDVYLFPSHSEGFPISVAEAMAEGLPVVASKVGAIPDMIDVGKGGVLCDVGDVESFCEALVYLRDNREVSVEMGCYNARKVEMEYEYSVVIRRLCELFSQLISIRKEIQ